MPYDDPDPTDPTMLVGVAFPGGDDPMGAMARVFADEFARLGLDGREIFALFEDPHYAGPHAAMTALGVPMVLTIIQEAASRWPRVSIIDAPAAGDAALPDEEG
jgi:hypothetical protein